jgi:hypothetical protein
MSADKGKCDGCGKVRKLAAKFYDGECGFFVLSRAFCAKCADATKKKRRTR